MLSSACARDDRGAVLAACLDMLLQKILVATDFSPCASRALDLAVELAQKFDAEIALLHVWDFAPYSIEVADYLGAIETEARRQLVIAGDDLSARYARSRLVLRRGIAWEETLAVATESNADLIALGTHGRRGLRRALLGSVAEKVVRLAACPVLSVRTADPAETVG